MGMTRVRCHENSCSSEERNVTTRTNHMCLGIDVSMMSSLESSEESSSFEDNASLQYRLRRLHKRTKSLYRRMKRLKESYIKARGLDKIPFQNLDDYINRHPCFGPLEFRGRQLLSIESSSELLLRLGQDYNTLTTLVGVLKLMQNDEEEFQRRRSMSNRMVSVRVSTERVICELFLAIQKLQTELIASGTTVNSQVSQNGLYTPVVRSWCSVRSESCRHERNGVILTQLLKFVAVLRRNYRVFL